MSDSASLGLFAYCRAGFEKDLLSEITEKAAQLGIYGYGAIEEGAGYVLFTCYESSHGQRLARELTFSNLIFARQIFACVAHLTDLPQSDRISPILDGGAELPVCGELRTEYADTTQGRELSKFCRKFTVPLRAACKGKGILSKKEDASLPVLHAFFVDNAQCYLGYSYVGNNSDQPLGILRLKFPQQAPSRSTLKLDEAIQLFVPKNERATRFREGMQGVDLGACPGGWTYQLVRRGLMVSAVDNGSMDEGLMATGQVEYFAEDGFKFKPKRHQVHWLVCDMIEQPQRVAKLMATWLVEDYAKEAIFNLKLPMKSRFQSVQDALHIIHEVMQAHRKQYQIQAKHLYHDREEITLHLRCVEKGKA